MKTFAKNFMRCGLLGWCMEILFTSLNSLRRRDLRLTGSTSLWMFPIYGMAALLQPVCQLVRKRSSLFRGSVYAACILGAEYVSGSALSRRQCCPWNYGRSRWNIRKIIRLDYLPVWFFLGLLFERVLKKPS